MDYATGLYAAFAVSAALFERERMGEGQLIRLSLLQTAVAMTSFAASEHLSCGAAPSRTGNRHPSICPYNLYATADGYVVLAVANDAMWGRCRQALGLPDEARFATNRARLQHQDELEALLEARVATLATAEVVALLEAHKVSCAQVHEVGAAFESPPVAELGMVVDTGAARFVGSPVTRPGAEPVPARVPPALGQDEDEVRRTRDW